MNDTMNGTMNGTMSASSADCASPSTLGMVLGGVLSLFSGACVALSMVLQRFALTYPEYMVPVLCVKASRPRVWLLGFAFYHAANAAFAGSALLGP